MLVYLLIFVLDSTLFGFFFSFGIDFLFRLCRHSRVGVLKVGTKSSLGAKFSPELSHAWLH